MGDSNKTSPRTEQPPRGFEALKAHVIANKVEVALWLTRVFTIILCLGYLIPMFNNASNAYYKALLSSAATSALRLHQRLPRVSISREFLSQLILEDSCHYLLFSMIYLYVTPISLVIIPVGLFGLLHAASYALPLLDTLGQNSCWFARLMISLVELQSRNILKVVSLAEILLMPTCVIMIFLGRVGLLTPFAYYHFLTLRYSSRRNPYTRNMFRELRQWTENTAERPFMPQIFKTILMGAVAFTCRLAPAQQPVQE
ncbi:transmembrane protein 33-containing Krueppel homolog 2 [Arctopsyche grandis]|uniref:transmembrane protein 33-containing Krueppel homolog 2 n=1 Tax=Arctopsyche grandis TaxID=121162 RepID=UPI00406D6A8E